MIISLEDLRNIISTAERKTTGYEWSPKKYVIDMYEETEHIRQCDTAFPIQWHRAVTDHFNGLQNIGNWCWGYGENVHGIPLPCCKRSLVILEILLKQDGHHLIFKPNYEEES